MAAGIALGAAAVHGLHAQARPPGYIIGDVNVKDKDAYSYANEFLPLALKAIEDGGGKYLVRGGKTASLEDAPPGNRVVVLQFDSLGKAQAYWDSAANKDAFATSRKYATFRIFAVEGASPLTASLTASEEVGAAGDACPRHAKGSVLWIPEPLVFRLHQ